MAGRGNGNVGSSSTCLRKTRTSEDSAFMANFNEAQGRSMRKEVENWYKNTKNTLRQVSDNQQKLYFSLLELSKKKKSIKIQRDAINLQRERPQMRELKTIMEESDDEASETKKKRIRLPQLKLRPNPSEELNTKSSIQAMQGKSYQVSSYRRDDKGSLQEESKTIDTTVDVSQYFNFKYYRDRHVRQKLLEESRLIGGEQRQRVKDFLTKLLRDEEEIRGKAEMKAKQLEEEAMMIQKDKMRRNPPRYGLLKDDSVAPGYVRKYIRRPNVGSSDLRDKRRSSWYTPSLYTLQLKTPVFNRSLLYNNEAKRGIDLQTECSCSVHLVDMKLENYVKVTA